jgi:hypothetical protein
MNLVSSTSSTRVPQQDIPSAVLVPVARANVLLAGCTGYHQTVAGRTHAIVLLAAPQVCY